MIIIIQRNEIVWKCQPQGSISWFTFYTGHRKPNMQHIPKAKVQHKAKVQCFCLQRETFILVSCF